MTKATRGVHDPWRMGTPEWEPPKEDKPAGTKYSSLPFDWDLKHSTHFVMRYAGKALKVINASTPLEAAYRIIAAYDADEILRRALDAAGFVRGRTEESEGFVLSFAEHALFAPAAKSAEEGFSLLHTTLRQLTRQPGMKKHLDNLGLVPLIA